MKKIIFILLVSFNLSSAWEVTTHRAIDQTAMKQTGNLNAFVDSVGIKDDNYANEKFELYMDNQTGKIITYFNYFNKDKSSDGISKHNQTFSKKLNYQDLIEAGTMLEDAVWPNAYSFNGRFLNHFYDPQQGGKGLRVGGFLSQSAVVWAEHGVGNKYSYDNAIDYFAQGFAESNVTERRKYQAKMFVSVGHMMHLVNDARKEEVWL